MSASGDPVLRAIFGRRVTRSMTAEPVAPDQVDTVVRAARAAPNAGNRRLQPIFPVTDHGMIRLLRLVAPGMIARPPVVIVVGIDIARAAGYGFLPDSPGLYIDVGTAMATMLLAAKAIGLGAVPVSSFSRVAVARLLGLPESTEPRMLVCLGHAAGTQPPSMPGPATRSCRAFRSAGPADEAR
jgi:nitroreductase